MAPLEKPTANPVCTRRPTTAAMPGVGRRFISRSTVYAKMEPAGWSHISVPEHADTGWSLNKVKQRPRHPRDDAGRSDHLAANTRRGLFAV